VREAIFEFTVPVSSRRHHNIRASSIDGYTMTTITMTTTTFATLFRSFLLLLLIILEQSSSCCLAEEASVEESSSCTADSRKTPLSVPTLTLHNGIELPVLSLGTSHVVLVENEEQDLPRFMGFVPEKVYRQIQLALELGIRSFDSGRIYRSHKAIGHVLGEWFRMGFLERSDVFLISKVFHGQAERVGTRNSHMYNMEDLTPEQVTQQVTTEVEEALVDLGVGYMDLMLLHWPASANVGGSEENDDVEATTTASLVNRQRRIAAWKVLEEMYQKGWLRAIGVSNFSELHLEQLREDGATIVPMVNQIEASLSVQYPKIFDYCQQHNILCQAFSPLKRGQLINDDNDIVEGISTKYAKTAAQIALRYLIQMGYAVTFLSTNAKRMASNHEVFDFELTDQEMEALSTLPRPDGNWGLPTPYDLV
jgi:diketogulonate reductase-like aldo/keto reductase